MSIWEDYERESCWATKRRVEGGEYATVLVIGSHGGSYWYTMLEGEEIFTKIKRDRWGRLEGYAPVRLTSTKEMTNRLIMAADAIII